MEKYGFVYLWLDRKHMRYYVGCHWGTEDDGYVCSSTWMRQAYKLRPHDFKRKILARIYSSRADMFDEEHRWLQMINEDELGSRYYNRQNKKFNHWSAEELERVRQKMSERQKEVMKNPEVRKRVSDGVKKYYAENEVSAETRAKISEAAKQSWAYNPNRHAGMTGKTHSDETKQKMSAAKKGKPKSAEAKQKMSAAKKGMKWPKVVCPHCQKVGAGNAMKQYHFDRCKQRNLSNA
jgi:hypothetical protein